jgi:mannose-1-phosphate guanylyltransferase/phosphomannomutase
VLVLAGGLGTRSLNPLTPKTLQEVDSKRTVLHTIAECVSRIRPLTIVPVLGHLSEPQEKLFKDLNWGGGEIVPVQSVGQGTSGAVRAGFNVCHALSAFVLMGDSALDIDLSMIVDYLSNSELDGVIVCRYSDHPSDSDTIYLDEKGVVAGFIPKNSGSLGPYAGPKLSLSGILLLRKNVFASLPEAGDFQENLMRLASNGTLQIGALVTRFFSRDSGTPQRLENIRQAFRSGASDRRGRLGVGAVFIDRDGTLIPNLGDARKSVGSSEISREAKELIKALNNQGSPVFIVTNQPGVAKGKITREDVLSTFRDIQVSLNEEGAFYDDFRFCPHHPEQGWKGENVDLKIQCLCRKPSPGMLRDLAAVHKIELCKSMVIGDSEADRLSAELVGARYIPVQTNSQEDLLLALHQAQLGLLSVD